MDKGFCPVHQPHYYADFLRQLNQTKDYRKKIYKTIDLKDARRVLEIGCRMGVVRKELRENTSAQITAIDSDHLMIAEAQENIEGIEFFRDSSESLSMRDESYDIVICHYFFMWNPKPFGQLMEMIRVCKKGGYVVALAEPDYGSWMEYPDLGLGEYHRKALSELKAEPIMGRRLLSIFSSGGLEATVGVNNYIMDKKELEEHIEAEWCAVMNSGIITEEEYDKKMIDEKKMIEENLRIINLPLVSVIGKKIENIRIKKKI